MPFHVINTQTMMPIERIPGSPAIFQTSADAGAKSKEMHLATGVKHRIQGAEKNIHWYLREQERFRIGVYQSLPRQWTSEDWWYRFSDTNRRLYAHPSIKNPSLISFTESEEKGQLDIQSRPMNPGRFLKKFFPDWAPEAIAHWAAIYSATFEDLKLHITQDADEIERVYTEGPSSCMSKHAEYYSAVTRADGFTKHLHPTRVYAGPDLAIAYIEQKERGITARCVCWPEKKIRSGIYGDADRLLPLLKEAGYNKGSIRGARVQKIEVEGGFLMPYVDDIGSAHIDGNYINLNGGDLATQGTDGVTEINHSWTCDRCSEGMGDEDTSTSVVCRRRDEYDWCEDCTGRDAFFCNGSGQHYDANQYNSVELENGLTWESSYHDEHGFTCECGKRYVSEPAGGCCVHDRAEINGFAVEVGDFVVVDGQAYKVIEVDKDDFKRPVAIRDNDGDYYWPDVSHITHGDEINAELGSIVQRDSIDHILF